MAITDTGVPSTDPHTLIKNLIESNMVSPDGTWTPLVNTGWLEFKRQKTFQISIMPSYGMSFPVHLTEGATLNTDATQFMLVTLYADTSTGNVGIGTTTPSTTRSTSDEIRQRLTYTNHRRRIKYSRVPSPSSPPRPPRHHRTQAPRRPPRHPRQRQPPTSPLSPESHPRRTNPARTR